MSHNHQLNWSLSVVERLHRRTRLQQNVLDKKQYNDDVFHALLAERRITRSKSQRAKLSKSIRKHLRRALREQRNGRIEHVLDEFKDLDRLTHHARAPVHPCSTTKDEECPGRDDIFASDIGFESPPLKTLVREMKAISFRDI